MPILITNSYQEELLDTMQDIASRNNWWSAPINFGGVAGPSGGSGGPAGGIQGYLPQGNVAYDTTEDSTDYTPPSGMSLVDNLNHIRYSIDAIDGAKSDIVTQYTIIEDLTDQTDGVTTVFELEHTGGHTLSGLGLYLNGLRQEDDYYTISGAYIVTTFIPASGAYLETQYWINTVTQAVAQITVQDEGEHVSSGIYVVNFTGDGVVATTGAYPGTINVDITRLSPNIEDDGVLVLEGFNTLNFTGSIDLTISGETATISGVDGITDHQELTNRDSSVAHTQYPLIALLNAKGSLYTTANGVTVVALPVGNNNYVLTADSSAPQGLVWAPTSGELTKVSSDDTTPDYLENKITEGAGLTITVLNPGGDEELRIASDFEVRTNSSDTVEGLLEDKITGGSGITVVAIDAGSSNYQLEISYTGSGGGLSDQYVKVSADDDTADYLENKLIEGSGITIAVVNEGGDEDLEISFASDLNTWIPDAMTIVTNTSSGPSDEFEDTAIASFWSYYSSQATISEESYGLKIKWDKDTDDQWDALYDECPGADYSVETYVSLAADKTSSDNLWGGIVLFADASSTSNALLSYSLHYLADSGRFNLSVDSWTNYTTHNTTEFELDVGSHNGLYLRVVTDENGDGDMFFEYSHDGIGWLRVHNRTFYTHDDVGLGVRNDKATTPAVNPWGSFKFFRTLIVPPVDEIEPTLGARLQYIKAAESGGAGGDLEFYASQNTGGTGTVSSRQFPMTVPSSANLIVATIQTINDVVSNVTWNGTEALSQVTGGKVNYNTRYTYAYYIVNPTPGYHSLQVSVSPNSQLLFGASVWKNATASGPFGTVVTTTGSSSSCSLSASGGSYYIDSLVRYGKYDHNMNSGQTQLYIQRCDESGSTYDMVGSSSYEADAAGVTMGWSFWGNPYAYMVIPII